MDRLGGKCPDASSPIGPGHRTGAFLNQCCGWAKWSTDEDHVDGLGVATKAVSESSQAFSLARIALTKAVCCSDASAVPCQMLAESLVLGIPDPAVRRSRVTAFPLAVTLLSLRMVL